MCFMLLKEERLISQMRISGIQGSKVNATVTKRRDSLQDSPSLSLTPFYEQSKCHSSPLYYECHCMSTYFHKVKLLNQISRGGSFILFSHSMQFNSALAQGVIHSFEHLAFYGQIVVNLEII